MVTLLGPTNFSAHHFFSHAAARPYVPPALVLLRSTIHSPLAPPPPHRLCEDAKSSPSPLGDDEDDDVHDDDNDDGDVDDDDDVEVIITGK